MIGKLKGIVDYVDQHSVVVDVAGVGYIVQCSSKSLDRLKIGEKAELFIETHVREDRISLFGFLSQSEKLCFLKLLTVKGVGPKMSLQILGGLEPDQIYLAISLKDTAMFSGISGVGPKIIGRIFAELKDITPDLVISEERLANHVGSGQGTLKTDAVSALVNLGMSKSEAYSVVSDILEREGPIDLNHLIRLSLNTIAR